MAILRSLSQDEVIEVFLNQLAIQLSVTYKITGYPDRNNQQVAQPRRDIDAIAEAAGAPTLAIEHTIVETRFDQKREDAFFNKAFRSFNAELEAAPFPFGIAIWVPISGIRPGFDWQRVATDLRDFVLNNAYQLPYGEQEVLLPEMPFPVYIDKNKPVSNGITRNGFARFGVTRDGHQQFELIVAHNHPAGSMTPSDEDIETTKTLILAGDILGMKVIDHLIVSSNGLCSLRETHAYLWP